MGVIFVSCAGLLVLLTHNDSRPAMACSVPLRMFKLRASLPPARAFLAVYHEPNGTQEQTRQRPRHPKTNGNNA